MPDSPNLAPLWDGPQANIPELVGHQHVTFASEADKRCLQGRTGILTVEYGALSTIVIAKLDLASSAYREPFPGPAEAESEGLDPPLGVLVGCPDGGRGFLQHAQGEQPGFHGVGDLEALCGVGEGAGRDRSRARAARGRAACSPRRAGPGRGFRRAVSLGQSTTTIPRPTASAATITATAMRCRRSAVRERRHGLRRSPPRPTTTRRGSVRARPDSRGTTLPSKAGPRAPPFLPQVRRLAELVAKLRSVGILRLPAHQPRPGREQRLVHDLDPVVGGPSFAAVCLIGSQQPGVHELLQHLLARRPIGQRREKLLPVQHRSGALGRGQVAEGLPDDPLALRADALVGRLGVLGQGPLDTSDLAVSLTSQQLLLSVAPLPEPRDGEREKRKRSTRTLDGIHHLVDERFVLEPVALFERRLDQRAPQPLARHRAQRRQLAEDRAQRRMVVTPHQKVVAQRQKHADVRLAREPSEESSELRLRR